MPWAPAAAALLSVGGAAYGAKQNSKAAKQQTDALERGADADREAAALARQDQLRLQAEAKPGLDYLKRVIAVDPNQLTPSQRDSLKESTRQTVAAVRSSPLSQSGRSTTAAIKQGMHDTRSNMLDMNQRRQDVAAASLSPQAFYAGNNASNLALASGNATSSAIRNIGDVNAARTQDNSALAQDTLGSIAGIFAGQAKKSRY